MRYDIKAVSTLFHEFFKIEKARVLWERFDGSMGEEQTRYVVRRGDSVGIIPVCKGTNEIILVKQFRFPSVREGFDGYMWEIPAGMVKRGEKPQKTAVRELQEEIGAKPVTMMGLVSFYLSPGALDEQFHLYLARINGCRSLKRVGGNRSESEDLLIKKFTPNDIAEMIEKNEIRDGKTLASLLYYFFLNKG